jgi:hypothetical protein
VQIINHDGILVQVVPRPIKYSYYIRLNPQGEVVMTVNRRLSKAQIKGAIELHMPKIKARLSEFQQNLTVITLTNAIHKRQLNYLGQSCNLRVLASNKNSVDYVASPQLIILTVQELGDIELQAAILSKWYVNQAKEIFSYQIKQFYPQINAWNYPIPNLKVRKMRSRFGSYSKGTHSICLNANLIQTDLSIIDYVLAHEVSHILHLNHSQAFYDQLEKLYPSWQEKRQELRKVARELIVL